MVQQSVSAGSDRQESASEHGAERALVQRQHSAGRSVVVVAAAAAEEERGKCQLEDELTMQPFAEV